jgi:hypothetical protein
MKYRRKPVIIDATQWWHPGDHPAVVHPVPSAVPIPSELQTIPNEKISTAQLGAIQTLEGWMLVTPGDYIIRGVRGEHYACKPDIFSETYEPTTESDA